MKKRIIFLVSLIIFILGLLLLVNHLAYVLRDKSNGLVQDRFAQLEKDSVDLVFIGTSHQFCSIDPDIIYNEYGVESYMLATSAQTVPMSYYAAMEAIELQHPRVIVFEVCYLGNDFRTVTDGMSHAFFDKMPRCKARKLALEDLIEKEDRIYYYLPIGLFHNRWKELKEDDFKRDITGKRGGFHSEEVNNNWAIPLVDPEEKESMPEEMQAYLEKMVKLCEENNVELILYCAPFNSLYDNDETREHLFHKQKIFNGVGDFAKEHGLRYYNMFYEYGNVGLDFTHDFMDSQHLNCYGQAKFTRYMMDRGYFDPMY